MTINILFSASSEGWDRYEFPLRKTLDEFNLRYHLSTEISANQVDYIIYAPQSGLEDFSPFTRCKAVLNLWAGVEDVVGNKTLTIPFARMVDHGLTHGMMEWVVGHVMRHHLGMDQHILGQDGKWKQHVPPLAQDRIISILGLGHLGSKCAKALSDIGFQVRGWSRTKKHTDSIFCFSGTSGLKASLKGADFVILLLPATPDTENTLNEKTLSLMKRGAFVINPGRGPLINDEALLRALDSGQITHATLDVFRTEPLHKSHPYWSHQKVTVTPHIAAATRAEYAAPVIVENIRRGENGEPFLNLVNRERGY